MSDQITGRRLTTSGLSSRLRSTATEERLHKRGLYPGHDLCAFPSLLIPLPYCDDGCQDDGSQEEADDTGCYASGAIAPVVLQTLTES